MFDYVARFFSEATNILQYKLLILTSANSIVFIKLYERLLKSAQNILINPILKISRSVIQISISIVCLIYLDLASKSLILGFAAASL